MNASPAVEFKVVVLGDKGVGKSCLVLRFIEGYFSPKQQSTIGAFFLSKTIQISDGTNCKMQIWDTAGQERFRAMASMYYRNAAAAIVCFDITDEESFSKMKDWVQELKSNVPEGKLVIAIACNKTDLEGQRVVSRARAEAYARTIGAIYCETSAKENWGVTEIFEQVSGKVIELRGDELRSAAAAQQRGAYGGNRNPRLVPPSASGRFNDEQKQSSCCG
mmetsp:Transcript_1210/g.1587  ORF Transcript_1210/g.1587 Transcript_1210/m.1587 type:complete len:220 (-) Transcript_1210:351-1010(-)